jgi:hypothetical protein
MVNAVSKHAVVAGIGQADRCVLIVQTEKKKLADCHMKNSAGYKKKIQNTTLIYYQTGGQKTH